MDRTDGPLATTTLAGNLATRPVLVAQPMTPVRAMVLTLAVLFVLGLVWLLIQIRSIILLVILGILLAAAIEPLVNRFRRRGLARGRAILLIYAGIIGLIGVGGYLVVPIIVSQTQGLVAGIPEYLNRFQEQAANSPNRFIQSQGGRAVENARQLYENPGQALTILRIQPDQVTRALSIVTSLFGVIFTTVSVMIVAFYWMTEKAIIKRLMLGLFSLESRDRAHTLWDEIEHRLGGWARGQLFLMVVIGMISTIVYSPLVLDVGEFWFLLGLWAGLTEAVPFVGPFLGGGLAALVALSDSWQKGLVVIAFVFVLQQVEGSILVPRVMKNAVGLTPLAVILALLVGGTLLGILGAVLAIPVAAAIQVVLGDLLRSREEGVDSPSIGAKMKATLTGRPTSIPGGGVATPAGEAPLAVGGNPGLMPSDH